MNRRDFLSASTTAIAAGFFLPVEEALAQPPRPPSPDGKPRVIASPPVLQNPAIDGVTVVFAVSTISTGWVEYGPTPELGMRADDSRHGLLPLSGQVHRIRLTNLKPGTKYHYRIAACPVDFKGPYKISRGATVHAERHSFTTLDEGRFAATTFAVINDTHETGDTLKGLADGLDRVSPDLIFWNGDIFNDVRSDDQIAGQVLRFGAGTPYATNRPLCFVSGNHDVRGIHARSLERYVEVPSGRRYYTLRRGPVAFLVMDTGEDKPDAHAVYAGLGDFARYREEQRVWLERAIQDEAFRSAPFRVAVLHIPLWGGGSSEDSRAKWHTLLEGAKVHVIINGHIHKHSFVPADADRGYAQLVGGGPIPESATLIEGHADTRLLSLVLRDLSGKELGNYSFHA